jgi:glycosyltransferase involved in cell wall biosynthesis
MISEEVSRVFSEKVKVKEKKRWMIINGVDLERFSFRERIKKPKEFCAYTILSVGRLTKAKNFSELIKAFSMLKKSTNEEHEEKLKLAIAGEGELEGELRALCLSLDLSEAVTFLGLRRDVPELLCAAELFVLPSVREGCPLSLIEAAANGIPIVTSGLAVMRELLAEVENVVHSEDQGCVALAAALKKGMEQRRSAVDMNTLEKFGMKAFVRNHTDLYRDLQ